MHQSIFQIVLGVREENETRSSSIRFQDKLHKAAYATLADYGEPHGDGWNLFQVVETDDEDLALA